MAFKFKWNIWYTPIVLILILSLAFGIDFLYRTLFYRDHLTECIANDSFCGIQIINLTIPPEFVDTMLELSITEGTRIEIPKKHQKNIPSSTLEKNIPELEEWYNSIPTILYNYVGTELTVVPSDIKTRIVLVVYEKEGDYIDWHFDTNHYDGRFFTLLVPITTEETCGSYQYRNHNGVEQSLELSKGQAIFFEGDKVFHRGKELCANERRVILSMTFVTDTHMNYWNHTMHKIKELGVFGK